MTKTGTLVLRAHVSVLHFPIIGQTTCLHHAGFFCDTGFSFFPHAFGSLLVTCDWQVCHLTWSRHWTNVARVFMVVLSTAMP